MPQSPKKASKVFFTIGALGVLGISLASAAGLSSGREWNLSAVTTVPEVVTETLKDVIEPRGDVTYLKTPEPMYAIYMSQCVVGTPSFREKLVKLIEDTPLNAVVIDVKDYSGTLGFVTGDPRFEDAELVQCGARDMKEFVALLNEKGIYTIARITVFQDPFYTKKFPEQAVQSITRPGEPWKDHKGLSFVDVSSREYWDYIITFAKYTHALGFDELNFDYIRYPSDGPMQDAKYVNNNKPEALEKFFQYLYKELHPTGAVLSADIFGMTTTNTDDLNIGQQLERALPYFDYIAPMVYPSHYPKGFLNLDNPNNDPYLVINHSMKEAARRTVASETKVRTLDGEPVMKKVVTPAYTNESGTFVATSTTMVPSGFYTKEVYSKLKLRPWLQDFDYGKDYTKEDIKAQIEGTYDAGLTSWYFWDPANRYENVEAYFKERSSAQEH